MKLSFFLFSNVLLSSAVLAAPLSRVQRRAAARLRKSGPLIPYVGEDNGIANASHVAYSNNWAGAVITSPPAGQTFNAVSAQVTVPTVTKPPGATSNGPWSAAAWVGIDGDTAGNSILQTGIDFTVSASGAHSFDAWYEWYPNVSFDFGNFPIAAGDVISMSVVASSSSAGTVTLENVSSGKSVSKALKAPSASADLAGKNAEWIVEDFEEGSSLVPLVDFGSITFTNCVAKTGSETLSLSSASLIDIKQGSTVRTDATIESSSELGVKYV
ncbi:hypothetical protein MMC13_004434 [Lambiella insularis]|nr:hypothetical protein [Lambiella insularis]